MKRISIICVLACLCLSVSLGNAGDKKISKKQIPEAVVKAFAGQYPHAVIKGQAIETENGIKYYEIESMDGTTGRDLLYTPEGKVCEIEETMDPGTLSDVMKNAMSKEYPKGKIVKAEKTTTRDTVVTYEVQVKVGKKIKGVSFDAQGNMMKASKKKAEKEAGEENEKGEDKED
jgi:hypothetical protein